MAGAFREMRVDLRGLDAVLAAFAVLPQRMTDAAKEEVTASTARIAEETRSRVRVDTGFLRDHVSDVPSDDGLAGEVGWFEAVFIEQGRPFYAGYQEFGTSTTPANPALVPAFEAERPRFVENLRERLRALTTGPGGAG